MYPWEIRKKRRLQLEKLLTEAGLKLVKVRDTSITLGCFNTKQKDDNTYDIVNEIDESIVYSKGLTYDEAVKQTAEYNINAQKAYPKLSGDEALSRYMDDIYQLNSIKKIKNKFPKEALPEEGYEIKQILDSKGIFRKIDGNIVGGKFYNFVVTKSGKLKIGNKHHYLGNAQDVLAAGSIRFKNGKIVDITNLTGHYKPNLQESLNFVEAFKVSGIPIKKARFRIYEFIEVGNGYIDPKLFKTIFIDKLNL
jgi:hypothetical protein